MNELKMKAKAGVTLVELLVVILIVTILSVSMLPLLQPFVTEAQYAAEAIPVIGNIRTKIGVYQYDKTKLPQHNPGVTDGTESEPDENGEVTTTPGVATPIVETWKYFYNKKGADTYQKATFKLFGAFGSLKEDYVPVTSSQNADGTIVENRNEHFGVALGIDQQDLKGKRSRPPHYEYVVLRNGTDYIYAIGVFGDGEGLKLGTGYAVCEINLPSIGRKYVGTWKRYKPIEDTQVHFTDDTTAVIVDDETSTKGCPLPQALAQTISKPSDGVEPDIITNMRAYGWEF